MEFHLKLTENETKEDINTLSVTNALIKFINEHNKFYCNSPIFEHYIFINDIVKLLQVLVGSEERFYNNLKEEEGLCLPLK